MKRGLVIFGIIVLVLGTGLGAGYLWLTTPVEPRDLQEPGSSFEARQRAGLVDTMLAAYGVTDAIFLPGEDSAYIGYEASDTADANHTQVAALLVMAEAAPDASKGSVVLHVEGVPKLLWTADLDALRAADGDGARLEAWISTIEKREMDGEPQA